MKVRTVKDYYERLQEKFPDISLKDISKILNVGWRNFYMINTMGGDFYINNKITKFFAYCGKLEYDSIKHFERYKIKLSKKIRRHYEKSKAQWDGYYYFGLTDNQYETYLSQFKKRGRKPKEKVYGNIVLYKLFDECSILNSNATHIFRKYYGVNLGYELYMENYTTSDAEEIEQRRPLKFKDILVTNHKYDI